MGRQVIAYKNYFIDFYKQQDNKVQEKIEFQLSSLSFWKVLMVFTKSELLLRSKALEYYVVFDKGELVVLTNSFVKKSQKTPRKEIKQAEKLKKEYFNDKNGG
jgi:hypothetical protein